MTLLIPPSVLAQLQQHLEAGYPNEACGALVGEAAGSEHHVLEFHGMRNTVTDQPRSRYALDPLEQLRVQRDAEARGLEIIGFAHSHPDHPAVPSQFDAQNGWPFYSYLVASVQQGRFFEARAWRLREADQTFHEEVLTIG